MYYTYILSCKDEALEPAWYIGFTHDLRARILQHQRKNVPTTRKFGSIKLVYYEACLSKKDARKRELQLKTGFGRGYVKRRLEDYLASVV